MFIEQIMPDGEACRLMTLTNSQGMSVSFMDWGATWLSCNVPLLNGQHRQVVLGCANVTDYLRQSAYLGATVGRYANRIAHARLSHNNLTYKLAANQGQHQLHGGAGGFHQRRWQVLEQRSDRLVFGLYSADGDQGFPGAAIVSVEYHLAQDNRLIIRYTATVNKPCPINLTNHAYFNLDGEGDARHQRILIKANQFLPIDDDGIPLGSLVDVSLGDMDLRRPRQIMDHFFDSPDRLRAHGYDHAYLLDEDCCKLNQAAACLWSADNQLMMEVYTTQPALQFYSGNFLQGTPNRQGGEYANFAGIALETQCLPDSPNHPEWPQPDCWLSTNNVYRYQTDYRFIRL